MSPTEAIILPHPGYVQDKHYTEYVDSVKALKRDGNLVDAEILLLKLVDATEAEARAMGGGVAPWYYEQLAIIYRKQKRHADEVSILERYETHEKGPGTGPDQLAHRLRTARVLKQTVK
jgi:hypothetical protein